MLRILHFSGFVAILIASSLAKPLEEQGGYTKTKVPRIEKVKFHNEIIEIEVEDVNPFNRSKPADEGYSHDAYQTDMILNQQQKAALSDDGSSRTKRKATTITASFWPGGKVPYVITSGLDTETVNAIKAGMAHWEECTGVVFVPFTSGVHQSWVKFIKDEGCYSYVGRQGGAQVISIGTGCTKLGIVAHEIGHAVGFNHEQSRSDRDNYVEVDMSRIQSGFQNNFDKSSTRTNLPYDFKSVMHYGARDFGINGQVVLKPKSDPFAVNDMGQRDGLSFWDIKMANILYPDDIGCPANNPCGTNGYRDKNCKCHCSDAFTGDSCDIPHNTNVDREMLTSQTGEVSSPGFDGTTNYANGKSFSTYIKGGPDELVRVHFDFFDLEKYDTGNKRCWDTLKLTVDDMFGDGTTYCGNTLPPDVEGQEIMLNFHSDDTATAKGYHATFVKVKRGVSSCPTTPIECQGNNPIVTTEIEPGCEVTIQSPNYPSTYSNNAKCTYTVTSTGNPLELTFTKFNTETNYDFVTFESPKQSRLSGIHTNRVFTATGSISLTFTSDSSVTKEGFAAKIKVK